MEAGRRGGGPAAYALGVPELPWVPLVRTWRVARYRSTMAAKFRFFDPFFTALQQ